MPGPEAKVKEKVKKLLKARGIALRPIRTRAFERYVQPAGWRWLLMTQTNWRRGWMATKSKNPPSKRDYKKEYARDQKKRSSYRSELNKKNREAGTYGNGDGKDVSHVKDVRKGGAKGGQTTMKKASTNRGWRKGKKGYDRG